MNEILANFHFLRPWWFYALIPAIILFALLWYRQRNSSNWEQAIDPSLLSHLLENPGSRINRNPLTILLVAWCLTILALAGPVWQKTEQPIHEREDALVILLDLSRSMYATDVKPNRLVRAQRKLQDLLNLRNEGVTALIVFSGDAHVVSPLTDDADTISSMIPALTPEILPAPGSRLAPALQRAITLFEDAGVTSGRILIITDEIRGVAAAQTVSRANRIQYPVSIMSVGTTNGAPVLLDPDAGIDAGYLKDQNGNLIIPKVDQAALADFASVAGGRFIPMTLTDEDLEYLLAPDPFLTGENFIELDRDFDIWHEQGPWLLLLLVPLAAFAFRRGWLWMVLLIVLPTDNTYAFEWEDLWQTRDQQGMEALQQGQPGKAAQLFESPDWKGSALYKSENYQDAASQFDNIDSTDGRYNLGNAFARQMRLEEAIEAYDEALKLDPDNEDAAFNKQLVENLLEQMQEQAQQQNQQQEDQNEDSDNQEQQTGQEEQQEGDESEQQQQEGEESEQQQQEREQANEQEGDSEQQQAQDAEQAEQEQQELAEDESRSDQEPMDSEEQQALLQWLRRIPDDPGGLLRRKFQAQHDERLRQGQISRQRESGDW